MSDNTRNLSRSIEKSKNEVTVLFTDIVDSTKFWDKHGDTAGRLMLDRHNTLLFPVVEAFKGTIIKTIGDSIMASFKTPNEGVKAAIAMQQQLRKARRSDKSFKVHIRIGIHTGQAIVESNDVYGDTVNVAARVEGAAKGDEILVSEATARKLTPKKSAFGLKKKRHFVPKGKRRRLSVWVCDWSSMQNLTDQIRASKAFPPNRRQHFEIALYGVAVLFTLYLLFREFLRYYLADHVLMRPYAAPIHPFIQWGFWAGVLLLTVPMVQRIRRFSKPPVWMFRLLKGGCCFGLLFFSAYYGMQRFDMNVGPSWNRVYYQSKHRFVEIVADDVFIQKEPKKKTAVISEANKNEIYVFIKRLKKKRLTYAKVALFKDRTSHGYIMEKRPAKIGVPALTLVEPRRLTIRYKHLWVLLLGGIGFIFGVWSFRLKPL